MIEKYRKIFEGESFLRENKVTSMNEKQLFDGGGKGRILPLITDAVKRYDAIRVLDYGCGFGNDWHMPLVPKNGRKVTTPEFIGEKLVGFHKYDPAHPLYDGDPPGIFNLVICTDVLEHVPINDMPGVLKHIRSKCTKDATVLISIPTIPSKNAFLDGENMHCTLLSKEEWYKLFNMYLQVNVILNLYESKT